MKFILFALIITGCSGTYELASDKAPPVNTPVSKAVVDSFLTRLGVPPSLSYYPVLDSLPNRTYSLLFNDKGYLNNIILCNSDYQRMESAILFCDKDRYWIDKYLLKDEAKAVKNLKFEELDSNKYYLFFYWSIYVDNLAKRNILALEKFRKNNPITIVYINIDNIEEYGLTVEEFENHRVKNKPKTLIGTRRWFE